MIEDKTPFLGKGSGVFCFTVNVANGTMQSVKYPMTLADKEV